MLAGHCDQIGLIVQHVDDEGFLYVQPIGGWDAEVLIGQRMTVWTAGGASPRRDRPEADPPADRGRAQTGPEDERPLAGHRGQRRRRRARRSALATPSRSTRFRELRNGKAAAAAMDDKAGLLGRDRGFAAGRPGASLRRFRRLDGPGGTRAARGPDQRLRRRSAGGRGRRRDPRHRLPHHGEEGGGRRSAGQGAGDPPRTEHESQGCRAALVRRRRTWDRLSIAASAKATGTDANAIQIDRAGVAAGLMLTIVFPTAAVLLHLASAGRGRRSRPQGSGWAAAARRFCDNSVPVMVRVTGKGDLESVLQSD